MWTYQPARRPAAEPADLDGGSGGAGRSALGRFRGGHRSENTFQELYARLPEAELYRSDAYGVYQSWLPPGGHVVHLLNGAGGSR